MLTAVSVARDCGIIPLGQRVVVAHGLSGHSGEPAQLLYTNANNNHMPSPLTAVSIYIADIFLVMFSQYIRGPTQKKNEINPIAREPRVGGERQTDGCRTCSDLSQCYKSQLDRFTQYKWTHLQT